MSHREKSLTPWIKPGSVANDGTVRDEFKTVLSPTIYDAAVAKGCDMSWFIRQEPILDYLGIEQRAMMHSIEMKPGYVAQGSVTGRWPYTPVRDDTVTDKPALEPITNTNTAAQGYAKLEPSYKPRWPCRGGAPKKHRDSVSCHDCMPGLGGRCTCCVDKE